MSDRTPFQPTRLSTLAVAANTVSQSIALNGGNVAYDSVRVANGASDCRIEFGTSAAVAVVKPNGATPGSLLIKAGFVEVVSLPPGTTHVAAACDIGLSTIEFTRGIGQ